MIDLVAGLEEGEWAGRGVGEVDVRVRRSADKGVDFVADLWGKVEE